ncbi:Mitochondrial import inner membrane translocase subunit Tim21 [Trinorchestia longiramus]|nr:Mitochondrial import inner membrane translocase subunit Tim21 [Trinorchestia longiramus]
MSSINFRCRFTNGVLNCTPASVGTLPSHSLHSSSYCEREKAVSKHVRQDVKFSEKAKEATKTTYYTAVVLAGLGITGLLFYTVFGELFASFSPQSVYSDAVKQCCAHPRVQDVLGNEGLKCYGEETRRGRRQHVSHLTYEADGQKGMRIMFHIKGSRRTGTAWLDARDSSSGWYYRYLYVQLDNYPQEVIVVQDNRGITDEKKSSFGDSSSSFLGSSANSGELTSIFPPSK